MPFAGGHTWAQMIKAEIVELKIRMSAIESKLSEMGIEGTAVRPPEAVGERIEGAFARGEDLDTTTRDLVKATYVIRSTAVAMRGYLMLLDQAGLSRNQKEMVRELEYIMMAAMKAAQTIKLLILAYQTMAAAEAVTPMGVFYLALAGGVGAASIAYSNKTLGGGV